VAAGDQIAQRIRQSGLSIYDTLTRSPELVYPTPMLEARLNEMLVGQRWDAPVKTRSKLAKTALCLALGYQVPSSFRREQPRFPGQDIDMYVQMENNLQIWNQDVSPTRRYVLVRVDASNRVVAVRVLTGAEVALLDRTGTLTSKFQAKRRAGRNGSVLVSTTDTPTFLTALAPVRAPAPAVLLGQAAGDRPMKGVVYTIGAVFELASSLVGTAFVDPGASQDRVRGIAVQRLVATALSIGRYSDTGQFPDIQSQVLEVKVQLAPTIDLGLVAPDSTEPADAVAAGLRHSDMRYAVFYAVRDAKELARLRITEVVVTTGQDFFREFQQFGGKVSNSKLQIPLPRSLFA
jgi:hypothetical protein